MDDQEEGEIRKSEFIGLFERSGWSQAQAARELDITRAHVNGIITGPNAPSPTLLKFFRLIMATPGEKNMELKGEPSPYGASRAKKILQQIETLQAELREALEAETPKKINSTAGEVRDSYFSAPRRKASASRASRKSPALKHPSPSVHAKA